MLSSRTITLAILFTIPVVVYCLLGAYALWQLGWFPYTFWILPVAWFFTFIISKLWTAVPPRELASILPKSHQTTRDEDANQIIQRYQDQVQNFTPAQLTDPEFYLQQGLGLARDIASHYHPNAQDPIDSLTVPEILAATRLAIDDMERWMLESVPGSRMLTIRQWKWLQHAPKWSKRIQDLVWIGSVLYNPANAVKYVVSQKAMNPISAEIQTEFLAVLYLRFVRQTGFYLIEMNSGRLRAGADTYRETFGSGEQQAYTSGALTRTESKFQPESLTVAIVGQVKAGKSSLVNALLGKAEAKSDVLPETSQVNRYQYPVPDSDQFLTLLDTPGYADAGATSTQIREVKQAIRQADIMLFVMAANSPAKAADRKVMDELMEWRVRHPELKQCPIIICLTHIDLLSPAMQWSPPYNWREPSSKKEESIAEAVGYVSETFGDVSQMIIPVCTDVARGRVTNVIEELIPAIVEALPEGKMVAVVKLFHQSLGEKRFQILASQLKSSGKFLIQTWLSERLSERLSGQKNFPEKTANSD